MAKVKNGRIVVPVAEADGVARVITSGQKVAPRSSLIAKLERYVGDQRFDKATREMYAAQLADVKKEAKANG